MNRLRNCLLLAGSAMAIAGQCPAAGAKSCTTESRLPLVLRPATAATTATRSMTPDAYLVGDLSPGLRIIDAASGRLLWTAGPVGAYTQRFAGMTAGFTSSLVAIDTDGDGAHDRLYAGDLSGRVWRFDIDIHGPASGWVSGGIFADLSGGAPGRGFLAAPDLALIAPLGMQPWLSIALGTASTSPGALNRFYVLRDREPFTQWTQARYDRWQPISEADLRLAEGAQIDAVAIGNAGFYVNLGATQVAAAALTLNGVIHYTVADTGASLLPTCDAPRAHAAATVNVAAVSAVDGSFAEAGLTTETIHSVPAHSAITLVRDANSTTGGFVCEVAGHTLPGCSVDSTLRRSFWRREDAD